MNLPLALGQAAAIVAFAVLLTLVIEEAVWRYAIWSDERCLKRWREWQRQKEEEKMKEREELFTTLHNSSDEELGAGR